MSDNPHPIWRQERCDLCKLGAYRTKAERAADGPKMMHITGSNSVGCTGVEYWPCTAPTEAEYIAELTARIAELERDKARMDWLEATKYGCWGIKPNWMQDGWERAIEARGDSFGGQTVREAIDAAMNQAEHGEVKPQSFKEGYPVYVCRQCSKQYKEHGPNEECPVGKQREGNPK